MATSSAHFTDTQKSALVQLIITGGLSLQQACAQYGLSMDQLKEWVCLFRRSVRQALDHQLRDTLSVQGLELDDFARPEFSGNLSDIGVDDLLQTIQMGRKDAHITIAHGGEASEIWCRNGQVVDARSGSLEGEKAFYRILAIERGSLIADFAPNERRRRIEVSTPRLLLEAASSTGLHARLMYRIGDPSLVFTLATELTAHDAGGFERDELDVLGLFDGARSVEEVILTSGLPHARALEIIAHFRDQGLLLPCLGPVGMEGSPPSCNVTMSYRPFVASPAPEPLFLPAWVLACGAVLCSCLGAVTAIAYVNANAVGLEGAGAPQATAAAPSAGPEPAAASSRPAGTLPAAIVSRSAVHSLAACPERMVWIEGGEFLMGTDSSQPALSLARPAHRVQVTGFCLDAHEVTTAEYAACSDTGDCMPAHDGAFFAAEAGEQGASQDSVALHGVLCNAGKAERRDHPVNCVSHAQAAQYCRARAARLPSEAEWEFAARGPEARPFPWGNDRPTRVHLNACGQECERWHSSRGLESEVHGLMYMSDDGYAGTAPVGSFPGGATRDGVEDLGGNVFEWTAQGVYDYRDAARVDPRGPADTDSFVIRGGNFNSGIREFADPALRFAMHGESYSHGVGFRCAAQAPSPGPSSLANPLGRAGAD